MAQNTVEGIERTVHKTYEWLVELCDDLGVDDRAYGYRVLRAMLHLVRDRVTVDEAADFAAQLPTLVRGVFYEGWQPSKTPQRWRNREEFLQRLAADAGLAGPTEAAYAAAAVTNLLRRQLTEGQVDEVFAMLPADVRAVLESNEIPPRP